MDANQTFISLDIPGLDHDLQVRAFTGKETLNQTYDFNIQLVSERPDLDLQALLHQPAYLRFGPHQQGVHGLIYRVAQEQTIKRLTHYRISLRPQLAYLEHQIDQRIFQNLSVPQIIAQVLQKAGIQADQFHFQLGYDYPERNYCVQYGESSLDFIQRLCEEEGISFHFRHSPQNHQLVFGDDESVFQVSPPTAYQQDSGMAAAHEVVRKFGVRLETRSTLATWRDYDFEQPSLLLDSRYSADFSPELEVYNYPGRFTERLRGRHLAKRLLERLRHDYELADGTSDAQLFAGHFLTLNQHPRNEWNDLWLLLEVEHRGYQPQVLEEDATFTSEQGYHNTFKAIPWYMPYRPPLNHRHRKPQIPGSQTALVTGPPGEEIHCDQYGRVKVQFHWDRLGQINEHTSCWLRVAHSWAGSQYGATSIPRIGMEVLVSFLEGDPDQPLITGCLYHKEHEVPYELPAHKTRTVFKSNSSPGGNGYNELRIEDRKGQEQIYIHAQRDLAQHIRHDQYIRVGHERHDRVENNSYSLYQAEDNRTTDLDRKVEIKDSDHLDIIAQYHQRTGQGVFVQSGHEIHYHAGQKAVVDAGIELTLQAAGSFVKLDPSGINLNGATIKFNAGGQPGSGSGLNLLPPQIPNAAEVAPPGKALRIANINPPLYRQQALAGSLLVDEECCFDQQGDCPIHYH